MDIDAKIEQMPFQHAIAIKAECKMLQMGKVMGQAFSRITEHLKSKDVEFKQEPFARYYDFKFEEMVNQGFLKMFLGMFTYIWRFEAGFGLDSAIEAPKGMEHLEYQYGKVATCMHKGPYQKVGATYKALYLWMMEKGLQPQDTSFELYLNDPKTTPAKELETKILVPCK